MSDKKSRPPVSFRLHDLEGEAPATAPRPAAVEQPRQPRAIRELAKVEISTEDPFAEAEFLDAALTPDPAPMPRPKLTAGGVFAGAAGLFVALALGLWADSVITGLFARYDWLGWAGLGVAAVAVLAFLFIVGRELVGLADLASVARLQQRAAKAREGAEDIRTARALEADLVRHFGNHPGAARGRAALAELKGDIIDGPGLLDLAETELLRPLDIEARRAVLAAAKRVSVVTAVSPRAIVDAGYVIFEAARLIGAISRIYGGRAGALGMFRLTRAVLGHLAVTGTIAVGDSLIQQVVGHGVAARLSARLGEGIINGLLTARVGIAAMDVCRPMPFHALGRPRIGDFLSDLGGFGAAGGDARA